MRNINLNYIDRLMKTKYENIDKINYFTDKKLGVEEIKNGIILPVLKTNKYNTSKGAGGVIDEKMNYVESSAQLAYNMQNRVYGKYHIDSEKIDYIDETVIYGNFFYKHWGHFIIDIVSRLWYLLESNSNKKYRIVFTTTLNDNTKIDGNYMEFFNLFGLSNLDILIINKPTKFKKIIIPEPSIYPGKYYTSEYVKIFEKVINNVNIDFSIPPKVYLSRRKFENAIDKEIGENDIEKFFNENGYISIFPESLKLCKQIQYYRDSKEIACISGTLAHNIMFTSRHKKVTIINKTYKINKHQQLINQAKEADVTYVDSHISLLPIAYGKGPFILTKNINLKRYANDKKYYIKMKWNEKINNFYKKIWYIKKYKEIYKSNIYDDKEIKWIKLLIYYLFK